MATVVIIDDSADIRLLLSTALEVEPGFDVVACVSTGADALAAVRTNPPDIVVLDALLPDDGNFETLRAIRTLAPECRIIVFSAAPRDGLEDRARRDGASDYVEKNGSITDLLQALEAALAIDLTDEEWEPDELSAVVAHGMLGSVTVAAGVAATLSESWDRLPEPVRDDLLGALRSQARELREALAVLPAVVAHQLLNEMAALFMAAEKLGSGDFTAEQRTGLFRIVEGAVPRSVELLRSVVRGLPPEVIEELDKLQRSGH